MSTHTPPTIGQAMRVGRASRDLTQEALSLRVRCSRQTIMSIENSWSDPGFHLAVRIARALGFRLDDVVPNEPIVD